MTDRTCRINDSKCTKGSRLKLGLCTKHYTRFKKFGDPQAGADKGAPNVGPCARADCDKPAISRGWCSKHYNRWLATGTTDPRPPRIYKRTPIEDRYWAKVDKGGSVPPHRPELGSCWPWTGSCDKDGYAGNFWDGTYLPNGRGNYVRAGRWAYRHFVGPIPEGHGILHHCDNPPCMNFAHWFTGTNADNTADREAKERGGGWKTAGDANGARLHPERMPRGEDHEMAKLTEVQVREIRRRYAAGGIFQYTLAAEFGVAQTLISAIVRRKIWQHI